MLEIRLLGQFDVRRGGELIAIPSRPAQSLLAYLILNPGVAHRREKLAGLLSPDSTEENARSNLRHALWRIRKSLGTDPSTARDYLLVDEIAIAFDAASNYRLDAAVVDRKVAADASPDDLIGVASAYGGDLLPGFYDEWVVLERERLQAVFEHKMKLLLDRLVEARRWEDTLEWGERWIALGHVPEPAYRALMVAHGGMGDLSQMVATYRRCVEALTNELGVEPSGETRALFEQLRSGSLSTGRMTARPGEKVADFQPVHPVTREAQTPVHAVPTNLPVQPTPFIGRERELAEIVGLLENPACRLLTLIGPGGIGKTRLAIQAAERLTNAFPHGVYFVPLAPLSSAEFLVSAVVNELGLAFYGSQDPKVQLLNYLHDKEMLLVMDNFEHLLAEDSRQANGAGFLAESLASAPGLRFIVTSRERLNLQGEWLFEIGAMDFPESETAEGIEDYSAVQLFLQTAHRVQPDFILSQAEQSSVVRICRAVGGMPLALELAAAWVRALPCAEIAARIEGNLSFLATSLRDVPERHRNMRAALDHSWKLLSEEERRAFRRLSVFQGGFELEAAEQVAEVSLPLLVALVDKSLVRRHASGRYDLHELLRQYASDKLSAAEETDAARRRHRDRYLNLALAAEPLLWGAGDAAWLRRLEAEQCNLRAALEWSLEHGDAEERLSLPAALGWFWYVTARFVEGRRWLERALATSIGASAQVRAKVLHRAASLAMMQQDFGRAVPLIEETLAAYRALETPGDPLGIAWMIQEQGCVALFQGDFERAAALFAKSLAQFQAQADTAGIATLLMRLGITTSRCGDYEQAVALLEESLPLLRELGDGVGVARALHGLGMVAYHQGHFAEATALLEDSLTVSRERGARLDIAQCLEGLASTAGAQGQPERAARLFGAAEALRGAIGAPLPPADRAGHERDAAAVRAQLGKAAFDAASAEGRAMTMEQAIAYATGDGQE